MAEPLADDTDLLQRIVGDDQSFRGAFLETYLNACFRQAGWNVERAPELSGPTGRPERPDFVIHGEDSSCYFEAAVTSPKSSNPGPQQRLGRLLDRIDHMPSANFELLVQAEAIGPTDVPVAALERNLGAWLMTLNPDDDRHLIDLPEYRYSKDGWLISFEAVPIPREHRGSGGRAIGGQMFGAEIIADHEPLTNALRGKAKKYRGLDAAYVIVVDEDSWEHGGSDDVNPARWHRTNTLFGSSGVITSGPRVGQRTRLRNGFWRRWTSYQNTRVSAVLLTDHLSPQNALETIPELWINPAATHRRFR